MIRFLFLFLFLWLSACTTLKEPPHIHTGIFKSSYPVVWQSILLAMEKYPLKEQDQEGGEITTKKIKGYSIWKPPPGLIRNQQNRHYILKVILSKGLLKKETAVKVQILKEEFVNKDFIHQSIPAPSNGIEEEVLLYRIGRLIKMAEMRQSLFKAASSPDEEEAAEELK